MTYRVVDLIRQLLQCMVKNPLLRRGDLGEGTSNGCLSCSPLRDGAMNMISEPARMTPWIRKAYST